MSDNDYIVKPVYKALRILRCLGEEERELSFTEICHKVGLPKTTAFRYLYTLQKCGFVTHDPRTDLYSVGVYVWELGELAGRRFQVKEVALPLMRELRERLNETVNLGVLSESEVVYLEMVESQHRLRMQAKVGSRDPVYSTALGKVILAFLPEEQWRDHLPSQLSPRTSRTHTSVQELEQELFQTRERSFAWDDGENEEDVQCIAAPIFDRTGVVTAAISVSAPTSRMDRDIEKEIVASTMRTASEISRNIGHWSGTVAENNRASTQSVKEQPSARG